MNSRARVSRRLLARAGTALAVAAMLPLAGQPIAGLAQEGYKSDEFTISRRDNNQYRPHISGKFVVWQDYRNIPGAVYKDDEANADIYGRDIEAGNDFKVTSNQTAARPAVSGNRVVYADSRRKAENCSGTPCGIDIRGFNIDNGDNFDVVERAGDQDFPAIDGALVVWQDKRSGNWDIRGRDIDREDNFDVVVRNGDQIHPAISGKIVVWEDYRKSASEPDIFYNDLDRDDINQVTDNGDSRDPSVSGDWIAYRTGDPNGDDQRIRLFNWRSGERRNITDRMRIAGGPRISGNLVVWADKRNDEDYNIWMYDISTDQQFRLTGADKDQVNPDISGKVAVWEDARGDTRDIRGSRITTPASTTSTGTSGGPAPGPCQFILGFGFLHGELGGFDGGCVDNEHDDPNGTGDRVQFTLNPANNVQGYMVWQKKTNTMRWTDGFQTYTYSSCGLQRRLNTQSWIWENNPDIVVRGVVPPGGCGLA